ncbi:STRUBBELIG-receptor family 7-like protein isoform X2 [Tanacetum coccineum]|uniref:STRUBBELIG-receptor family 7-like protein isoform X2 n=1 Tax=Tanacetum coccineum TaxID=301880 RepID=A0ABQ4XVZ1_9ASTR
MSFTYGSYSPILSQSRYCGVMMLEPFWRKLNVPLVCVKSDPIEWIAPHVDMSLRSVLINLYISEVIIFDNGIMEQSISSLAFKGSIIEAITEARRQKKLFVVYISDVDALESVKCSEEQIQEVVKELGTVLNERENPDAAKFVKFLKDQVHDAVKELETVVTEKENLEEPKLEKQSNECTQEVVDPDSIWTEKPDLDAPIVEKTLKKTPQKKLCKTVWTIQKRSASLAKVKAQVSEVKGVMIENIEKVLDRGEKIELLFDKTENLRSQFFTSVRPKAPLQKNLNSPGQLTKWTSSGGDPCADNWFGVTCSASTVTQIKLSSLGLSGGIGYQLSSLTSVTKFDVNNNNLGNQIPYSLPPNLTSLDISANSFTGGLPQSFTLLSSATDMNVANNKFTAWIPNRLNNINLHWMGIGSDWMTNKPEDGNL